MVAALFMLEPSVAQEVTEINAITAYEALSRQEGADIITQKLVQTKDVWQRLVCDDDIDKMERNIKPPQRFANYQPDWRVESRTFEFNYRDKTSRQTFEVVFDGDKFIALVRGGDIQLVARTPDDARATIDMPTERLHLDNLLGPSLPTWGFLKNVRTHGSIYEELGDRALINKCWEAGEQHLTMVRTQELPGQSNDVRFVFTVDPVYGYRIDAIYDILYKEKPEFDANQKLPAGTFTPGCYVPWAYQAWFDRTVYTPEKGGMTGWGNNLIAMDRSNRVDPRNFNWRDEGFIAYLPSPEDWSPCFTRKDGAGTTSKLNVCNAHNDFHITIPLSQAPLQQTETGYRLKFFRRLLSLPPEMTAYVWENMDMILQGRSSLVVKLGEEEDFEDQPVALTNAVRGLVWTGGGPEIVRGIARSGNQSVRIKGRSWPNLPQVSLLPGVRYRLEGWLKIEPWNDAQRVAEAREAARKSDSVKRAQLEERDHPLPPPVDWNEIQPGAYIGGDFYDWSPHTNPMREFIRTTRATIDNEEWQHVYVDFTAPDWGPFINIYFMAEFCDALLDDFALRIIGLPNESVIINE